MGTVNRRPRKQHVGRITPDALVAYAAGDRTGLHKALRLPPWQASPLDAEGECPYPSGSGYARTWADSLALREALHGHG